jgi:hypothetical protein
MVRLGIYIVKKRYKRNVYQYEEYSLRFPKELHDLLRCLANRELEIKASKEGKSIHIILIDNQKA